MRSKLGIVSKRYLVMLFGLLSGKLGIGGSLGRGRIIVAGCVMADTTGALAFGMGEAEAL